MKSVTHRWQQSGHFFPKLGNFFPISEKGQGKPPPPLPSPSYAPDDYMIHLQEQQNVVMKFYHS